MPSDMHGEVNITQAFISKIQGELFELSVDEGIDSAIFVERFMNSQIAKQFDRPYSRAQWAGVAYIWDELMSETGGIPKGECWSKDAMFWMGYTYRYWHYLNNMASSEIYTIADGNIMNMAYPGSHTLSTEDSIRRFIERSCKTTPQSKESPSP